LFFLCPPFSKLNFDYSGKCTKEIKILLRRFDPLTGVTDAVYLNLYFNEFFTNIDFSCLRLTLNNLLFLFIAVD
jgi:hypothetical protein